MKIKKIVLMTMFLAICFNVLSKDRFVMAKIIMNNNDTIVNPIRYENVFDFQAKIEMMNDDGIIQIIYPLDAKGFYIIAGSRDTVYFESNCGLKLGMSDNDDKNCYFMLKKKAGKFPLYYFASTKLINFGPTMKTMYSPSYVTKYRNEWFIFDEDNYVSQLQRFIKPLKRNMSVDIVTKLSMLEDDLSDRVYRFDDIPRLFDRMNDILK